MNIAKSLRQSWIGAAPSRLNVVRRSAQLRSRPVRLARERPRQQVGRRVRRVASVRPVVAVPQGLSVRSVARVGRVARKGHRLAVRRVVNVGGRVMANNVRHGVSVRLARLAHPKSLRPR